MSPDQEHRLEEIFGAARDLPPLERTKFLEEACGGDGELRRQADSLLAAHEQAGRFLKPTIALSLPDARVGKSGDRIGHYKLLEQIGEGGFGVVWMADQQEPVRRRVALKILKLGMDTREVVARFEAERQALAMMDHPNIATVFDGGATDTGRPYFVMELVKGIPITKFCDERRLSTRERLDLFLQVCQAVQHAHQKGIIHRDLKPSNVLVTEQDDKAVPKVIDFGIAKATQARLTDKTLFTRFQQWMGTPAYMSPEQAGLGSQDVDTRSDVYSLGVLLYELLTGRTPFDPRKLLEKGYEAVMRTIREEEPPKPSTRLSTLSAEELNLVADQRRAEPRKLGRLMRGDLDWIVMKALEKDRQRRYDLANALAQDLEHYCKSEPVTAAPPSILYLVRRFIRRRRTAVAVAAALGLLLLVTAAVLFRSAILERRHQAALQAERASAAHQAALAQQAAARVEVAASDLGEARSQRRLEEVTRLLEPPVGETADVAQAVAVLARTIRESPEDKRATYRLMALLSQRDFARPVAERVFDHDVVGLAWTGDGLVAAVQEGDAQAIHRPVALVSFETGEAVRGPLVDARGVRRFSFIADGSLFWVTRLVDGGPQEQLWICDSSSGKPLGPVITLPGQVHQVVPEATEQRVAIGSLNRAPEAFTASLHVFDMRSGEAIGRPFDFSSDGMTSRIRFEAGGQRVLIPATSSDGCRIWNVETGTINELPSGVPQFALSDGVSDRPEFAGQEELRRPDWMPGNPITIPDALHQTRKVAYAPDGFRVATLAEDGRRVRMWDAGPTAIRPVHVFNPAWKDSQPPGSAPDIDRGGHWLMRSFGTNLVAWNVDGGYSIAPNTVGSTLMVWDLEGGTLLPSWDLSSTKAERAHLSPDGKQVLLVGAGTAQLYGAADQRPRLQPFTTNTDQPVIDGAFTADGSRVVTWSETGRGQVWRVEPQGVTVAFGPHGVGPASVHLSPDGRHAATTGEDMHVRLWDLSTGKEILPSLAHPEMVNALGWADSGKVLVTGTLDGKARVWEVETGRQRGQTLAHGGPVSEVMVPEGSDYVVTSGEGQAAKLWDLHSGALVRTLEPGSGFHGRSSVGRGAGGALILFAGSESRVLDPATGLPLSDRMPSDWFFSQTPALSHNGAVIADFIGPRVTVFGLFEVIGPAPVWLPELAEAIAGKRLSDQGTPLTCSFTESRQILERLREVRGNDAYSRWLRWYLVSGPDRPLHPYTRVTPAEVVRRLTASPDPQSIRWGLEYAPLRPEFLEAEAEISTEALATSLARPPAPSVPMTVLRRYGGGGQEMIDFRADEGVRLACRVLKLVPNSEAAWKLSALCFASLRQTNAAVQALAHVRTAATTAHDWYLRGRVLGLAGDAAGAEHAYNEASALRPSAFFRARPYDQRAVARGEDLPRDLEAGAEQIDLTSFYNARLADACLGFDARNNLSLLPAGLQVYDRVRFDTRGIVQLARESSREAQGREYPSKVQSITVGLQARRLHFLHGTGWTEEDGVEVGSYVVHYADGQSEKLPIRYASELRDWWVATSRPNPAERAAVAWSGPTPAGQQVCLYHWAWENPHPELEIASLDFLSAQTMCAPFLIAITAEP